MIGYDNIYADGNKAMNLVSDNSLLKILEKYLKILLSK